MSDAVIGGIIGGAVFAVAIVALVLLRGSGKVGVKAGPLGATFQNDPAARDEIKQKGRNTTATKEGEGPTKIDQDAKDDAVANIVRK